MLDIVIVNWNSGDYLKKCIDSIFINSNEKFIHKVIIVDNNSTDSSLRKIDLNNKIVLINNSENMGFAKACNQGFRLCNAHYLLLLNPDAMLMESTVADCITFMNSNNNIDILGCRLIDDEGMLTPTCSRFPTSIRIFFDAIGLSKLAPSIFTPATVMTDWNHNESRRVDQVMGAFMFMRKNIFEKIGYFDERFFVYFEEVDFSKRLSQKNGITFYNASITAIHSGEGTTQSVKGFRLFLSLKSRLLYTKKYFSYPSYLLVWISTFLIEPFSRFIFLLFKGKLADIKELFKGYRLLLKNLTESDKNGLGS